MLLGSDVPVSVLPGFWDPVRYDMQLKLYFF